MTSPLAIDTVVDLYRIIDEQPEWAEALRNRLLGAELLAMPRQLAQLTEETRALRAITETLVETAAEHTRQLAEQSRQIADLRRIVEGHTAQLAELTAQVKEHTVQLTELTTQVKEHTVQLTELTTQVKEHTVQLTELTTQVKEHTVQLTELTTQVKEHTVQLTELRRISDNQTARMGRIEQDSSSLKNMHSEAQIDKNITAVAGEVDLYHPIRVTQEELMTMARQLGLDRDTRRSFIRADLVFKAQDDQDNPIYGAVEVSWTADYRDTNRARRNAALLEKATGCPALAIVASNRWEQELDWNNIHWYQLED